VIRNQAVVQVTGWLNDVKVFDWGQAAKVSVDQRKQNAEGNWETVDKTVYDVTFDGSFPDSKQVTIEGRITGLNIFEKRDGTTGVSIKVRAESVLAAENTKQEELPF
jgi:hypothetical protein